MAQTKVTDAMRNVTQVDAAKITTGTIPDARIQASAVTAHVDTTAIENDISLLALQTAINGNLSAYGLKNSWIEQFENSTYIENLTQADRVTGDEFMATVYSTTADTDLTLNSSNYSTYIDSRASGGFVTRVDDYDYSGSDEVTISSSPAYSDAHDWSNTAAASLYGKVSSTSAVYGNTSAILVFKTNVTFKPNGAQTAKWMDGYGGSTDFRMVGITSGFVGTELCMWKSGTPSPNEVSYTETITNSIFYPAIAYNWTTASGNTHKHNNLSFAGTIRSPVSASYATGSFNSTDVVPQDATNKSSVGLVMLYKDNAGTNTLDIDIIAKVRANTGQAYQTLALRGIDGTTTPSGAFSDGMKIAIAPAIAVTAGQALSYEISFANQASSSKEARIYGIAMTY